MSTKKPSSERGTASSCEAPAPGAKLRHRPVELRRRHVAGVELVGEQHVDVFLLDRPLRRVAVRRWRSAAATRSMPSSHARRYVRCSSIHLRGNPALVAEDAQLGVGAVVMDEAREEERQERLPARVAVGCRSASSSAVGTRR